MRKLRLAASMSLAALLLASAALPLVLNGCSSKKTLHVYTWADYICPDLLKAFEDSNNCNVVVDTFDSNESMYAKLMAGASGYDIIMPTEYVVPLLVKAGIVDAVDMSQLPNVSKRFDCTYSNELSLVHDVPYAFSCTGILWRKDKVPPGMAFLDWNDLFDARLARRICIFDDIRELLGIALIMSGHSGNSTTPSELDTAAALARAWKAKASKMDNESYRTGIPLGEVHAAMAYNSDAVMLLADDPENIGYSIPTNGTMSSVDVMCVMKSSSNKELAHKFIDMFYVLSNAVANAEYICAPVPVTGLHDALSSKYKAIPFMQVSRELKARCEDIQDVGGSISIYSRAWDKVKAK